MRAERAYRALLWCYPAAFRDEYGHQMLLTFVEQLDDARRTGGRIRTAVLWLQAALDACTIAPKEHWYVLEQDLRYALRVIAARPGFAAVAVLSLALGIGANTAIFSLWNGVLHASLPGVANPEGLVMLSDPDSSGSWTGRWNGRTDGPRAWLTHEEFEALRDHAGSFSALMAAQSSLNTWEARSDDGAWRASGRLVSGGFFQLLGVGAAIGRVFTPADDSAPMPHAVISYPCWQQRFGGSPDVLGRTITLRTTPVTIIGVTPRGFVGETAGQQPDVWLPLGLQPRLLPGRNRLHDAPPEKTMWLHVFGRLKPGVTGPQAEAEANAIFQAGLQSFYGGTVSGDRLRDFLDQHLRLQSGARGASAIRTAFAPSLTALLAAVGVLLVIACANLANLLLARGAARRSEIAVRLSLGANRGRLVRQLVTESLVLAATGGIAGLVVARVFHGALVRMLAESDPRFHVSFALDSLMLVSLFATTLGAALLFGVLPAWQATKTDAGAVLKEQGRSASASPGHLRVGRLMVSLQLALSLPLLVGAGLLVRTVYNLQRADLGFDAERLLLVRVDLRETDAARHASVRRTLLDRFQRIPGVRAASFSQLGIFSGGDSTSAIEVDGYVPKGDRDRGSAQDVVGPGYFSTLGIPIRAGREIAATDRGDALKVCVINDAFAKRFFAGRSPIGLHLRSVDESDRKTAYEVVGVAGNARTQDLRQDVEPRFFLAADQTSYDSITPTFLIRAATQGAPILAAAREIVPRVDPALSIVSAESIEGELAPLTAQDRATARLAVVFGCVALALAAIGLYGVLSYGIVRRRGEIAIRMALGARPGRVVGMILRETIALVVVGMAAGGGLAFAGSRVIGSRLYGVAPQDPITLTAAAGLLLSVALGAAYLPARRASKLDPIAALHQP